MAEDGAEVAVGRLFRPRGIQGEVWCEPLTDFPERFHDLDEVIVELPSGERRSERVVSARFYGKRLAIRLGGYETPEAVAKLRGGYVLIPKSETVPLPEDTFYVFDLVGLPVVTEEGAAVGRVEDVLSMPANDVFVVRREEGEVLVPAVKAHVEVDRETNRIVVRGLEGLL